MAKKLQLRRGTTSQHSSFTGAEGEVTVDTDKDVVVVHDGSTAGGKPMQAEDAELTELATMASGTASALADLTQAEVQILDGATVTTAELNILDGVTSTAAELNILDGVTSTTAELNTLDGFTGDKDDLNYAKDLKATGVTSTEFDYLDGVTSNIQTQLGTKAPSASPTFSGTVTSGSDIDLTDSTVDLYSQTTTTTSKTFQLFSDIGGTKVEKASITAAGAATFDGNVLSGGASLTTQGTALSTAGNGAVVAYSASTSDQTSKKFYIYNGNNATFPFYVTAAGAATFTDDVTIDADGKKLLLGASDDIELQHDGSNSYIVNNTGSFYINTTTDDGDIYIRADDGSGGVTTYLQASGGDGQLRLYHYGNLKFNTTSSGVKVTGAAVPASITGLTDGATIAVDFSSNNNYSVTLGGNRTLGQPSNQTAGQSGSIFVTQDGTGSRTLAYHADWKWAGGTAPTLSTAANAVDRIDYIVAAANKVHAVASLAVA